MSKFQIILTSVFGVLIVAAVLSFSFYRGNSSTEASVSVWGSLPAEAWNNIIHNTLAAEQDISISYTEKNKDTIVEQFTEALAEGRAPDLILISQEDLWMLKAKLMPISYKSISERTFRDTFAEGAEIFLLPEGIMALPLSIDPLVLYYNRDSLSSAGIAKPLAYWDEMYAAAGKLTKRDAAGNITQSVMALGEAVNIPNAKEILSLLFMQAGTAITELGGPERNEFKSVLAANPGLTTAPADSALEFYTQFANPAKVYYSWNKTLDPAQTHFTAGESAYYAGFASELPVLLRKSPTINLGAARMPQSRINHKTITFGKMYGLAISRGTGSPTVALVVARRLIRNDVAKAFSELSGLPPARRDLLSDRPAEPMLSLFYDAALQSRGWLDPAPRETRSIFADAVGAVTSGKLRTSGAVNAASRELESLIRN